MTIAVDWEVKHQTNKQNNVYILISLKDKLFLTSVQVIVQFLMG